MNPQHMWSTIKQFATEDTAIYVCDLYRPESKQDAQQLVDQYARRRTRNFTQEIFIILY